MLRPNLNANSIMNSRDFQVECYEKFLDLYVMAMFSDPGTGKTKTSIDLICGKFLQGKIDNVIICSWPFAVHDQWVLEQFPKHQWRSVKSSLFSWDGKRFPKGLTAQQSDKGKVKVFSFNIEALRGKMFKELLEFCRQFGSRTMFIVDESQTIKENSSLSSKALRQLGGFCRERMIMSGSPIAKSLMDEWAQFNFLDPSIINIKYKTAFQSQFCIMGGFQGRVIVGSRNVEQFNEIIAPYTFRATKDQLGLPSKLYDESYFSLTEQQYDLQRKFKETMLMEIDQHLVQDANSTLITASNVGVSLMKLQQIANGFVIDEDGNTMRFDKNPRIDNFEELFQRINSKMVVWCRFREDILMIQERMKDKCVTYYGGTHKKDKDISKHRFLNDPSAMLFLANAASAGTGVDGLQTATDTAVYYSQSHGLLERLQTEDRTNRFGTTSSSLYIDMIGRRSTDLLIVRNVRRKRDFSNFALADLKRAIEKEMESDEPI
jgi:hypothetical protein